MFMRLRRNYEKFNQIPKTFATRDINALCTLKLEKEFEK